MLLPSRSWILFSLLLLVVVGLAGWMTLGSGPPPHHDHGTLLSDCDEEICEWVLGLHPTQPALFVPTQADLIARSDPAIRFRIVHAGRSQRDGFTRALQARGVHVADRVAWHDSGRPATPWVRDVLHAGRTSSGAAMWFLHEPSHYLTLRGPWGEVDPQTFSGSLPGVGAENTTLAIDGGSVLADGERIFISEGRATAAIRAGRVRNEQAFLDDVRHQWGLPAVLLRDRDTDASSHCDLVAAAAGPRTMVLGSPALATELLRRAPPNERHVFEQRVRALVATMPPDHPMHALDRLPIIEHLIEESTQPARYGALVRMRRALEAEGCTCVEVPFLSLDPNHCGSLLTLSYANVVLDVRPTGRVVYLPAYGLPTLDRAAAEQWRRLGYRVAQVDCLGPALDGGGLRCLSQVRRRARAGTR